MAACGTRAFLGRVCVAKLLGSSCASGEDGVLALAAVGDAGGEGECAGTGVRVDVCSVSESMGRVVTAVGAAGLWSTGLDTLRRSSTWTSCIEWPSLPDASRLAMS